MRDRWSGWRCRMVFLLGGASQGPGCSAGKLALRFLLKARPSGEGAKEVIEDSSESGCAHLPDTRSVNHSILQEFHRHRVVALAAAPEIQVKRAVTEVGDDHQMTMFQPRTKLLSIVRRRHVIHFSADDQ